MICECNFAVWGSFLIVCATTWPKHKAEAVNYVFHLLFARLCGRWQYEQICSIRARSKAECGYTYNGTKASPAKAKIN
jgi:hypothetical protein